MTPTCGAWRRSCSSAYREKAMMTRGKGDADRTSLWAEQPPLAVVGGQGPHPHALNYVPRSRILKGGHAQSGRNHVVQQRKGAPGLFVGGAAMRLGAPSPVCTVSRAERIHGKEVEEALPPFKGLTLRAAQRAQIPPPPSTNRDAAQRQPLRPERVSHRGPKYYSRQQRFWDDVLHPSKIWSIIALRCKTPRKVGR